MEMILEVLRPNGVRSWHRVDGTLTLGRGLTNNIILDDPYVDANHARLTRDASGGGALVLEDLGSVNGLLTGGARVRSSLVLNTGDEVILGRTKLRLHDPNEPVVPALVDELPSASAPAAVERAVPTPAAPKAVPLGAPRWVANTRVAGLIIAAAAIAFGLVGWSTSVARSSAADVFSTAFGFILIALVWAGVWAAASRIVVQRFHFVGHLSLVCAIAVAAVLGATLQEWATFAFPDSMAVVALAGVMNLCLLAALIAWHLALASALEPRRRRQVALAVAGVVFLTMAASSLTERETFSDVPVFSAVLKPLSPRVVPTTTVDEFISVSSELKRQVDEATAGQPR